MSDITPPLHDQEGVNTAAIIEDEDEGKTLVRLGDDDIAAILDDLHEGRTQAVQDRLADLSDAETLDLLHNIAADERRLLIERYGILIDPYVYSALEPAVLKETLSGMPAARVATIISELDSDDALNLIINLDDDFQKEIIRKLSAKDRVAIEQGLTFPEDSAGRLMQREYVAIPQFWTVGKTIDYLRAAADDLPDEFYDLIVIDPSYHVTGEIPLNRLVRSQRSEKIESLRLDDVHNIPADMDQEDVAQIFRREGLGSAPVVDEEGRLIGVITVDDILDVIDEEAQEDILKLAGVDGGDLYRAVLSTTGSRFKWLFINLLTAILASIVISFFDATIQQVVALAVLMPIVASMGGNAGTQALTIAVRALSTNQLSDANTFRLIWKETLVGTLNGAGFAIIMGGITALWFHNAILGAVIAAAMVLNLVCAGLFGAGIPIILNRMGSDPALSSTVFLTTVTDVVGFLGFLGLASLFLI
jgi:magnesium transporter